MADPSNPRFAPATDKPRTGPGTPSTGAGTSSGGVVETVKDKVKEVANNAGELVSGAKDKVQQWASQAGDAAGHVKDRAQEWGTAAVHKAEDLGEGLTALIRRYPLQALLVGFGIGLLASRIIRRS